MQIHASCVAREDMAVVLLGPSGSGKSDLSLRLLDRGFTLVADDRVEVTDGRASAPEALAGLLEVRGLGLLRLPYVASARVTLAVRLSREGERLPLPERHAGLRVPMVAVDPTQNSAAQRVELALDCAMGTVISTCGAFECADV